MKRYIIRRILSEILTVLIVFALSFIIIKAAPGDPIKTLMGKDNNDPELRAALEEKWGLNEPEYKQFFSYLGNALHGDLGTSIPHSADQAATALWRCRLIVHAQNSNFTKEVQQ